MFRESPSEGSFLDFGGCGEGGFRGVPNPSRGAAEAVICEGVGVGVWEQRQSAVMSLAIGCVAHSTRFRCKQGPVSFWYIDNVQSF